MRERKPLFTKGGLLDDVHDLLTAYVGEDKVGLLAQEEEAQYMRAVLSALDEASRAVKCRLKLRSAEFTKGMTGTREPVNFEQGEVK